jgi:hypothetical protein
MFPVKSPEFALAKDKFSKTTLSFSKPHCFHYMLQCAQCHPMVHEHDKVNDHNFPAEHWERLAHSLLCLDLVFIDLHFREPLKQQFEGKHI